MVELTVNLRGATLPGQHREHDLGRCRGRSLAVASLCLDRFARRPEQVVGEDVLEQAYPGCLAAVDAAKTRGDHVVDLGSLAEAGAASVADQAVHDRAIVAVPAGLVPVCPERIQLIGGGRTGAQNQSKTDRRDQPPHAVLTSHRDAPIASA